MLERCSAGINSKKWWIKIHNRHIGRSKVITGKAIKLAIIAMILALPNHIRVKGIIITVRAICNLNNDTYHGARCSPQITTKNQMHTTAPILK
jgi:hypothetical protein